MSINSFKDTKHPTTQPTHSLPELFWLDKYDHNDQNLKSDICFLHAHEHIFPELLIDKFIKKRNPSPLSTKVFEYYQHQDSWTNRLIQGDSLLVMTSLLEKEGMAGEVQMIYFDPPYGIEFESNWYKQMNASHLEENHEHEKIRAYRDTWKLGIHSYLSYLRERLIVGKELLASSGACFVQISEENVHLVRCIMDEVFGRKNFVSMIVFKTRSNTRTKNLSTLNDYIIFYAKSLDDLKYHKLYTKKELNKKRFSLVELETGEIVNINQLDHLDDSLRPLTSEKLQSSSGAGNTIHPFEFQGRIFKPVPNRGWRCSVENLKKLVDKNRIFLRGNSLRYKYYYDDFPAAEVNNLWLEQLSERNKTYTVQTSAKVIQRCLFMTTDPGDLVLDPSCGGGTTAYVAEQWARRWITIDTSRIALNITKKRLMMAAFPYYKLQNKHDLRQDFIFKTVNHITMRTVLYDLPPKLEKLYEHPKEEKNKFRITSPFVVETLQNPLSENLNENNTDLKNRIFEHLRWAGIKNGMKNEKAIFLEVNSLSDTNLHAEGFFNAQKGQKKAYFHIGPKFGLVNQQAVNAAVAECQRRGDADWLIILAFSFESNISNKNVGHFALTKVRMHDDLLQRGLAKDDKKAASFVTIGEPNIQLRQNGKSVQIEICGFDVYNPIKGQVETRKIHDIGYWMVDDDYDGSNFIVKQIFFCGGNNKEFKNWQSALNNFAKKRSLPKIEINKTAFARAYGQISHPITIKTTGHKIAVRVSSQFGEESTKILEIC